jgi:STAS-like domain of unknown function (DUF4325)
MVLETGRRAMRYVVNEITGPYALTPDGGQALYDQIHPVLVAGQSVALDFSDVKISASPFFNVAIGQLLKDLSPDQLNQNLSIENLNNNGQAVLKHVIENAKRYYLEPKYQHAVDHAIKEFAASC